jgi:hypothetical protein
LIELRRGTEAFTAIFIGMPASAYYVWEMRVLCASGKIELSNSPETLAVDLLAPHPLYPDFNVLTRRHAFAMEDEPLLERTFESLSVIATKPVLARAQLERETESQDFSGRVLELLAAS